MLKKKDRKPTRTNPAEKEFQLDRRSAVAAYYGFVPRVLKVKDSDTLGKLKNMLNVDPKRDSESMQQFDATVHLDEKITLMNEVLTKGNALLQPLMVYYLKDEGGLKKPVRCGLEIIGTEQSVAEAMLIKTALEILKEEGHLKVFIEINSIGDKDSLIRLTRELTLYYRKHLHDLPPPCRQLLKRDVFELLLYPHEKCVLLRDDAPKSMTYLSELSQEHFREVLEFLERMDIPYQIVGNLVGNRRYTSHVVFEIRSGECGDANAEILARGIRYNGMAKKIGSRKEIPAVGVALAFKPLAGENRRTRINKAKVFFIQLGFEAKLKSLKVIEMLRQEKIAVEQSLSRDKLAAQLGNAENLKVPYVLIMGQKEALEDSIIVRTMANRSQETVRLSDLSAHIKKLKYHG